MRAARTRTSGEHTSRYSALTRDGGLRAISRGKAPGVDVRRPCAALRHSYTRSAMPIYEYRCENGHTFEVMQRMTDDPVSACNTCDAPVQRVFHPVAVHFKGKGFYNTDYGTRRRNREMERSGESGDKAASTSSDGSAGGETKSTSESKASSSSGASSSSAASKGSGKKDSGTKPASGGD